MENIRETNIENELKTSYLAYAMSVNTNRAIPDVRDGLKPGTRRIIYAMGEINLTAESSVRQMCCCRWRGDEKLPSTRRWPDLWHTCRL